MAIKKIIGYGLILLTVGLIYPAFAQKNKPTPSLNQISLLEKQMLGYGKNLKKMANQTLNPNVQASHEKIEEIETFLKSIHNVADLTLTERMRLGQLLLKIGQYYIQIENQPDLAIKKLNLAKVFLNQTKDKAWGYNYLALSYQQKYITSGGLEAKEQTLALVNKVINELYQKKQTQEVAFAYCIKGAMEYDIKDYAEAKISFKKALNIYNTLPGQKNKIALVKPYHILSDIYKKLGDENQSILYEKKSRALSGLS